ncbi:MAG: uracil-DNA glycosylase [Nitrospirae bacterium CG_4_9_14_3_um_filter_53_35]|nr:MAG: uracil-DNA glycosylase [Nitrospirae bacterium CG08_land_8_20_14_0_20_52_24]PIV83219.1 MAG: uracil-DNA glycosylase [Nitrospirae bacterium CG17_big_fil_post_rev_8_21_14_2_50_50_9]PIW84369.1 MAG: uracil-DNA glycosylase [Nitrospirae bacterium CG_4_8_14_3_um_filter_50_41]PIX85011.1 MAG: uracil-DNA glycosylase [Nitrospirae bacterium CG_4_10_14_3_um_filter_53_41]PJA72807.1 MAG: uracil-DNA glycosylase [Nitrospirae bacterium CG_4_9_14_3_um_filter_53_35]
MDPNKLLQILSGLKRHLIGQMPEIPSWISASGGVNPGLSLEEDLSLEHVREILGECTRCRLHQGRKKIVFGQGDPHARLMFVGEGPGEDEDREGLAFVGKAGRLLTKIIASIDLTRDDVYITNVVKCRPPENREPEEDEIAACVPFLRQQIRAIRPSILCALGAPASKTLLKTRDSISRLRGRFHDMDGIKVMPTYHPAYLLRYPSEKRLVWEDMKKIRKLYMEP